MMIINSAGHNRTFPCHSPEPCPPTRQNPAPPTRQNLPLPLARTLALHSPVLDRVLDSFDSEFDESNSDEEETVAIGEQSTGEEPNQNSPNRESEESNLNDEEPVAIGEQSTGVEKIEDFQKD
uniref:Uncharacterized protein n=1 Tax=Ditylenchus dipsaci TaxID=166011 RepID=A0A915CWA8_9BILA